MKIPVSSIFSLSLNVADDLVTVFIIHIVDFQLVARCLCQYFETISSQLMNFWKSCEKMFLFLVLLKNYLGGIFDTTYFTLILLMLSCYVLLKTFFSFVFILTVFTFKTNTLFTGIFLVISSFFNDFTVFNWVITWLLNIFITVCFRWRISLLLQMLLPPSEVSFQWPLIEF